MSGIKLKIAMLGHKRVPSREGGVEIVVEELATRMHSLGHEVTVYNRKGSHVSNGNNTKMQSNYKGIKIKWVSTINKKGLDALLYSFIGSLKIAMKKYDVVHYHAEGSCGMLWIPKLFGKKIVVTIHGLDWQRAKWSGFATRYILFGEKMAVKYADEIIVLSKGVQTYFLETYNKKTTLIPNGVSEPKNVTANIISSEYQLKKGDYILFLARIVPEKGLHYLIEAYKGLQTDKKLVIAGGASHTNDYLEEIKKLVLNTTNIKMVGFVEGEMLQELYSNAYAYVLPSDVEGMPLSLLEAMSYGNACLVSNIPENVDVISDVGFTFKKGNVDSLKEELQLLLQSDLEDIKIKARCQVLSKYQWDKVVLDTLELYKKL